MDMNTIEAVVPTTDPAEWREGDAWLAGGTVLFSYGSTVLQRLLDLGNAGWPASVNWWATRPTGCPTRAGRRHRCAADEPDPAPSDKQYDDRGQETRG